MNPDYVLKAISDKLHSDLDRVFEEEKQNMVERLEREKDKTIAACMLTISKHLSIETMGETITLRIEKRD